MDTCKNEAALSLKIIPLTRTHRIEELESRWCLASLGLTIHDMLVPDVSLAKSVSAADLDGDGDKDVLVASLLDNKIAWYENVNGKGDFGIQQVISSDALRALSVTYGDADGDGDLDVFASFSTSVAWYENLDSKGRFGPPRILTSDAAYANTVAVRDIDGDGDLDVISGPAPAGLHTRGSEIAWYENRDGRGGFGPKQTITTMSGREPVALGDLNGDGDVDLVATLSEGVVWFENTGEPEPFELRAKITNRVAGSAQLHDFDGDSDLDVLFGRTDGFEWHANNGDGTFELVQAVSSPQFQIPHLNLIDFDSDGDLDVLASFSHASVRKIAWHENTDGKGTFGEQRLVVSNVSPQALTATDVDDDGDSDILAALADRVSWYENLGTDGFGSEGRISVLAPFAASSKVVDFDHDGDQDLLYVGYLASEGRSVVAWLENADGKGSFSAPRSLVERPERINHLALGDFNRDGAWDFVLGAGHLGASGIFVYEAVKGITDFELKVVLTTEVPGLHTLEVEDVDGDGHLDIMFGHEYHDTLEEQFYIARSGWYPNLEGTGAFGPLNSFIHSVEARNVLADIDGDGNRDRLLALFDDVNFETTIYWQPSFLASTNRPIQVTSQHHTDFLGLVGVDDVDRDGDLDFLETSATTIAWFENRGNPVQLERREVLSYIGDVNQRRYVESTEFGDLDGDGDTDLAAVVYDGSLKLIYFENSGMGISFCTPEVLVENVPSSNDLHFADLDADGDQDIVLAGNSAILWFESDLADRVQRDGLPGDANRDSQVSFADFLLLSANFGKENASWEDGDFDADGVVSLGDFEMLTANFGRKCGR